MRERDSERDYEGLRERDIGTERESGWERVRTRGRTTAGDRVHPTGSSRWINPANLGRNQQVHTSNWRDKKDISSFYFTRFSDEITEKDLWRHFRQWGDVREVFIPSKRNKNGRRYGFVRFKGVIDTHQLAKQMDGLLIGGLKMYVNVLRYSREGPRQRVTGNKISDREESNPVVAARINRQHHINQGSYAEVLRRNVDTERPRVPPNSYFQGYQGSMSSVHITLGSDDTNWLKDAWVGRLTNPAMFDRIEDEMLWETGLDISPKYIGDDLVLLLGLTDSGAEQLMNDGQQGGRPLFCTMEKWNPTLRTTFRLTWVQVWAYHFRHGT